MKRISWLKTVVIVCITLAVLVWVLSHQLGPRKAASLSQPRIYAYKDWQSIGIQVHQGDRIDVRAEGNWLYTPGEYHGPEGHRYYLAPDTYPINGAAGGVLLCKIGENGPVFQVGKGRTFYADRSGLIFFRINDDILSDNEGFITLEVKVTEPVLDD